MLYELNNCPTDSVREATQSDLRDIVAIHKKAFPEYFLTNLGDVVLRRYYEAYLQHSDALNVVASLDGKVCAFISGIYRQTNVLQTFYKSNLACVFFTVLYKLLTLNPVIIKGLSIRLGHVTLAIKARFSGAASLASEKPLSDGAQSERQIGRLVSIAALPEVQGRKISSKMLRFFEEQLKERGTNEVRLCVNADNGRAIQFYRKSGWTMIEDKGTELSFSKHLQ